MATIAMQVWIGTYLKRGVSAFFADYALAEFTAKKMAALIADPAQFIRVSQNKEGIDGFVRVVAGPHRSVIGARQMEIATLYVQPRHHGQGIGTRFLQAAIDHGKASGVDVLWLTTNAENDPAIAFYLAQGFTHVGEDYFTIDDQAYLNNVYALPLKT